MIPVTLAFVISADMIGLLMMPVWIPTLPIMYPAFVVALGSDYCSNFSFALHIFCILSIPFQALFGFFWYLGFLIVVGFALSGPDAIISLFFILLGGIPSLLGFTFMGILFVSFAPSILASYQTCLLIESSIS